MVKIREKTKRELMSTTLSVVEKRYVKCGLISRDAYLKTVVLIKEMHLVNTLDYCIRLMHLTIH